MTNKEELQSSLQALLEVEKTVLASIKANPDEKAYKTHLDGVQKLIEERKKQIEEHE